MKYLLTVLVVVLSVFTVTYRANANDVNVSSSEIAPDQANVSPSETTPGQAAALVTQPATINSQLGNGINQSDRLGEITNSIPSVHSQPSLSLSPIDFLKNPSASVKQFLQQKPNQVPQPVDPLGTAKTPPLDSEVRGSFQLPVSKF